MNNNIKVSIIIPVYNVEKYIQDCLCSVTKQTYDNYECLIIDDCGNDRSIAIANSIIKAYSGTAKYSIERRNENGGLSAARNTGIKYSSGDYLYFLDADDRIFPDTISSLVRLINEYPDIDIIQGNNEIQGQSGLSYLHYDATTVKKYYSGSDAKHFLLDNCPPTAWNKLVRREWLTSNNIYFKEGILHEDEMWRWDMHFHVNSIAVCYDTTYWYRKDNQASITAIKDETKSILSRQTIMQYLINTLDTKDGTDRRFVYDFISPSVKIVKWRKINDKHAVTQAIQETNSIANAIGTLPWYITLQIKIWKVPAVFMTNLIFAKMLYEWEKWCKHKYM